MKSDRLKFALAGGLSGIANGFFGGGGGSILVPLLTKVCRLDQRKSFATSVAVILPLCALISGDGLHIAEQSVRQTVYLDMPMCTLVAAIAVIPTILHKRFTKLQGILLLALYIAYVFVTVRI